MSFRTLVVLFTLSTIVAGCSEVVKKRPVRGSAPETEAELQLCQFNKQHGPQMYVRHHDPEGRLFFGDVKNFQGFADMGETEIPSAQARPKKSSYVQKVRSDCKNESTGRYYPCTINVRIDLSEVGAIARSNYSDPSLMAARLCLSAARQAWKDQVGLNESHASQECAVTVRAICPLPPAPGS